MTTLLDSLMKRNKQVQNTQLRHHSYLDDDAVIAHAEEASNSDKFKKLYAGDWEELYDSQSDADMALLSILAFWCGCDEEQMDRIFRTSGLMRDKWDRRQAGTTYGAISIRNTVNTCAAVYVPVNAQDIVDEEFTNLDPESKSPEFQPDITKLTLSLDEMAPHTNPRYGRDEIGMGNTKGAGQSARNPRRRIRMRNWSFRMPRVPATMKSTTLRMNSARSWRRMTASSGTWRFSENWQTLPPSS